MILRAVDISMSGKTRGLELDYPYILSATPIQFTYSRLASDRVRFGFCFLLFACGPRLKPIPRNWQAVDRTDIDNID